ncbi:unnamed protein product [Zymoseptoria tritici ST99CH_3D1]|nr:unnamed protein product [Zymoseptoria tritici ST99CH_3D1]
MAPPIRTHYNLPDRTKPSSRPPYTKPLQPSNASEDYLVGQWQFYDLKREASRKKLLAIGVDVERKYGGTREKDEEGARRQMQLEENEMLISESESDILQEGENIEKNSGGLADDDDDFVLVESDDEYELQTHGEDEKWELISRDGGVHSESTPRGVGADEPQGHAPGDLKHPTVRKQKTSSLAAHHPLASTQLGSASYFRATADCQVDQVPSAEARLEAPQHHYIPNTYAGPNLKPEQLLKSPLGPTEVHGDTLERRRGRTGRFGPASSAQLPKPIESSPAPANLAFPPFALNLPTITSTSVAPPSNPPCQPADMHPALKTLINPWLLNPTSHPAPNYHLTVQPPSTFRFKPSDPACHAALRSYLFPFLPLDPAQYDPAITVWEVLYVVERSAMEMNLAQREDGRDRGVAMSGWGDGTWREERRLVIWRKETGFEKWYFGL